MAIEGVVRICLRHEHFRMAFTGIFQLVFLMTLAITEVFFFLNGSHPFVLCVVLPPLLAVLSGLASAIICWVFHFEVSPGGLDWFTMLRSEHIDWSQVQSSRRVSFLGLDWLVIRSSAQRQPLWLPLFVHRYTLLRDLLVTFGDPRCKWDEQLPR